MVPTMLKQKKKAPKLRASAAQVRALVNFGVYAANRFLDPRNEAHVAAASMIGHLSQCYGALSRDEGKWKELLEEHSIAFGHQFVALEDFFEDADAKLWKTKPKLHQFLELASDGSRPALFWGYRDEDFGGSFSKFGRRRGGLQSCSATSKSVLNFFRLHPIIRITSL